ncbi:MAG: hypothetical protein HKP27_09340 [Myxococcales bacterium]|nr:hypothetical protein [Myxococcales bacterium]
MKQRLGRERRIDDRERASLRLTYRSGAIRGAGVLRNVATGGLFVKADHRLTAGNLVRLYAVRPDGEGEIVSQGFIWRTDDAGFAVKFTEKGGARL